MPERKARRPLRETEIRTLQSQGCSASDWSRIRVADPLLSERLREVHFEGDIEIGSLEGTLPTQAGFEKPCGIYRALLAHCKLEDRVRIAGVGGHLANYLVGQGALIEDVGRIETRPGATFGNGVKVEVLNEAGGREVPIYDALSSQVAHLLCLYRFRPRLIERLEAMAQAAADKARSNRGCIGRGARLRSVGQMIDVRVGDGAELEGCASLVRGSVLSSPDAPTRVGAGVWAEDFIIAEGSQVDGGAQLKNCYVGQGCTIGRQFSADACLFFANCEALHGEACSVFAGPYSVTHHKSTLLIAGYFSFYNAGSGTNQSNHMYKLGPLHEGKLERGCKTGSFAYLMWPCRVGPFSVILGKHKGTFDTCLFPFSLLEATPDGRCQMIPGLNLATVGTVRDGAKWPARDRRKGTLRRDRISFDVLSPLTVGRMIQGSEKLAQLQQQTDRAVESVSVGGVSIKRVLLRTGQKFYRAGIELYLLEKLVARLEQGPHGGGRPLGELLSPGEGSVDSFPWIDLGGQLMPRQRIERFANELEQGELADLKAVEGALDRIDGAYAEDEWAWVRRQLQHAMKIDLAAAGIDELRRAVEMFGEAFAKYSAAVLADATKEFGDPSRTGFGQDGRPEDVLADFRAVRGEYETNRFVRQMAEEKGRVAQRVDRLVKALGKSRKEKT